MFKKLIFCTLVCITLSFGFALSPSQTNGVVVFKDAQSSRIIGSSMSYFTDESNSLRASDVLDSTFVKSNVDILNFGISYSAHWLRFRVRNATNDPLIYLELRQPLIDEVVVYDVTSPGIIDTVGYGGDAFPFGVRQLSHPNHFFGLQISPNETREFLVKIRGGEQIQGLFVLSSVQNTMRYISLTDILFGLYSGIILSLFFYNLFIYFTVREKVYISYVIYILLIGLTQISLQGYTFKLFTPNAPHVANILPYLFSCMVGISALYFMRLFLNTKQRTPTLHNIAFGFEAAYIATIVVTLLGYYNFGYFLVLVLAGSIALFMLITGAVVYRRGYSPAKYYLLGWSTLLIGIIIYVLKDFNVLPTNFVTTYTMPIGSAAEVILLSFALASRINLLKKEKEASQKEALKASHEKAELIESQRKKLKKTVDERTKSLRAAIVKLRATQASLIESEKMASIGQLTAGIAHEINNPMNFVHANITPLKLNIQDLNNIILCYDELNKGKDPEQVKRDVQDLKEEIDYESLLQETNELFESIEDGANRTIEIVKGLRTFSSLDELDLKAVNINDGLRSTLSLLRSHLNSHIDLTEEYNNDLPKVECYPGHINQVFMNVLTNAIQAIDDNDQKEEKGHIHIKTMREGKKLVIRISDNGIGMPKRIIDNVFDPFFTTREVGKGTGLGLSTAYITIKKHHGEITVDSKEGEGTSITISLPFVQPQ